MPNGFRKSRESAVPPRAPPVPALYRPTRLTPEALTNLIVSRKISLPDYPPVDPGDVKIGFSAKKKYQAGLDSSVGISRSGL